LIGQFRPVLEKSKERAVVPVDFFADGIADFRVKLGAGIFPVPPENQVGLFLRSFFKDGQNVFYIDFLVGEELLFRHEEIGNNLIR
jgi:hypothetical protein